MNFGKLFDDYSIEKQTDRKGEWVNVDCPYCDAKGHYNLGFNVSGNYYHCWKSVHSYPIHKVLADVLSVSSSEVKAILSGYDGGGSVISKSEKSRVKWLELPTNTFTKAERRYLHARGFSPKHLHERYGVVGGGIDGDWKFRIIIPVYVNGQLVSWTARSILDKETLRELKIPRYRNLSNDESIMNIKELFFNLDNVKDDSVVLCEGAFDVMRFDGNAICSMGTELTEGQIRILSERFKKVFIIFDNEPEAQEKARKFGLRLAVMGLDVEVVNACEDFGRNDLGECTAEEIEKIKKELEIC